MLSQDIVALLAVHNSLLTAVTGGRSKLHPQSAHLQKSCVPEGIPQTPLKDQAELTDISQAFGATLMGPGDCNLADLGNDHNRSPLPQELGVAP